LFNKYVFGQQVFLFDETALFTGFTCPFFMTGCTDNDPSQSGDNTLASQTPMLTYTVAATYPHDTSSYTQGLEFFNGQLFEGTGNYGFSKLLQVDLKTGKASKQLSLHPKLFGEGITILNDTLYQLTWKEKLVLAYDPQTFKKIKEYPLARRVGDLPTMAKT
jgi:glutamine cyclotransferase